MNNYLKIIPFFYQWEGGLSRSKNDSASENPCPTPFEGVSGWHTNKGVTYSTWLKHFGSGNDDRFYEMNANDWGIIFKYGYWNKVKADDVPGQSIAEVLVSWAWGSGPVTAIKQMQRLLNEMGAKLVQDGVIGPKTMAAIKQHPERVLFDRCIKHREAFFRFISNEHNGRNEEERKRFKRNQRNVGGWINRLQSFNKKFRP